MANPMNYNCDVSPAHYVRFPLDAIGGRASVGYDSKHDSMVIRNDMELFYSLEGMVDNICPQVAVESGVIVLLSSGVAVDAARAALPGRVGVVCSTQADVNLSPLRLY